MGPSSFLTPLLRTEFLIPRAGGEEVLSLHHRRADLLTDQCRLYCEHSSRNQILILTHAKDVFPDFFMTVREKADPGHSADTFQDLHKSPISISIFPSSIKCILGFEKRATQLS